MKKTFFILILLVTLTNCSTFNQYDYDVYKVLVNKNWDATSSKYRYIPILIRLDIVDYSNPSTYINNIRLFSYTSRPIIFKNDIKIKNKNTVYIINKNSIETKYFPKRKGFLGDSYKSYINLYKNGIKINSDFILELGTINENGKDIYVAPLYYRKSLSVYKSNWILEGPIECLYSGWADEYGK